MRTALLLLVNYLQQNVAAQTTLFAAGQFVLMPTLQVTFVLLVSLTALIKAPWLSPKEFDLLGMVDLLPDAALREEVITALKTEPALAPLFGEPEPVFLPPETQAG